MFKELFIESKDFSVYDVYPALLKALKARGLGKAWAVRVANSKGFTPKQFNDVEFMDQEMAKWDKHDNMSEGKGYDLASEIKKLVNRTGQKINLSDKNVTAVLIKRADKSVIDTLEAAGFKRVPANGGTAFYKPNMNEAKESDYDFLYDMIGVTEGNMDQFIWDWFEENLGDSGIYAGDAVPEDYLEIMSDKQIKTLAKAVRTKYKTHLKKELRKG